MWTVESNLDEVTRHLDAMIASLLPETAAVALNLTAAAIRKDIKAQMPVVFDRPTQWTIDAFFIRQATASHLVAAVEEKDPHARRDYLKTEVTGGPRRRTAIETLMKQHIRYSGDLQAVIPGREAELNRHGNWSPGQRNKVLSGLGAQRDKHNNTTEKSKKRHRKRSSYFVPDNGGLYPAIFERPAGGGALKIVALLSSAAPQYAPRLDFEGIATATAKAKFPQYFAERMAGGLAKAWK